VIRPADVMGAGDEEMVMYISYILLFITISHHHLSSPLLITS
jgi:hypothetical protein